MDYADKLDMMDDDCDIQGYPNECLSWQEGELIIYQNGDTFAIGKIKRVVFDGAFVWYNGGDTASKTPFDCMHKIHNAYCIVDTLLGGGE